MSGLASALGALGLLFGVWARVAVTRLTPEIRVHPRSPVLARYPDVELTTMAVFVVVGVWAWHSLGAPNAMVIGYLALAWASVVLTYVDLRINRLPNAIVYPTVLVLASSVLFAAFDAQDWDRALVAFATACVLVVCYAALWLVDGLGLGDVKLSLAIGLALGWIGWPAALIGTIAAFTLSGCFTLLTLSKRSAHAKARIPFGPWMFIGAWIGLFATSPVTA